MIGNSSGDRVIRHRNHSSISSGLPLLVAATRRELAAAGRDLEMAHRAEVVGIGPRAAANRMREILSTDRPPRVIEIGLAGGLDGEMEIGDLLVGRWVRPAGGVETERLELDETLASRALECLKRRSIAAREGGIVESRSIVALAGEKAELGRRSGARCVTMETGAIHAACDGIPHLVVRAVFDPAGENLDLPAGLIDSEGRLRLRSVAGLLLRRPQTIGRLLRYGRWERRAFRSLRRALVALERPLLGS
jgi:hypothetical protein